MPNLHDARAGLGLQLTPEDGGRHLLVGVAHDAVDGEAFAGGRALEREAVAVQAEFGVRQHSGVALREDAVCLGREQLPDQGLIGARVKLLVGGGRGGDGGHTGAHMTGGARAYEGAGAGAAPQALSGARA